MAGHDELLYSAFIFLVSIIIEENILYAMINMKNKSKLKNKTYIQ